MKRIIYVPFDQLNVKFGALKNADRENDLVLLVESQRMRDGRRWHKQRLHFLTSSARHFALELQAAGFKVIYRSATTTAVGIEEVRSEFGISEVVCARPNSYQMRNQLLEIGVKFIENDFFLTTGDQFTDWANAQKSFTMENFYREQRQRFDLLMEAGKPLGGAWNYDDQNRLPPPKDHDWGNPLNFSFDEIDDEVASELPDSTWGQLDHKYWATTRAEALSQLEYFLENHFADFGPFEDAMPIGSWSGHHSLISPYLNNGLLHPAEVITAAIVRFEQGDIPIASCEGFIRQIVGWREYINGMYWYLGEEYRESNGLNANRDLLPVFINPTDSKMNCVKTIVTDIQQRGWTHHIPRLMVLGNLALLSGVSPKQFLDWMREVFVDAADWVMVPNVIGMATHADGGSLMTKPYAAGGAYISKMGQYCKGCSYNPKNRTSDDACPFTTLYWDFLDRNFELFNKNHRMFQQISGLKRLSDLPEVRQRAKQVLKLLEKGQI
ncbi:MAG: cryptochrome/photolyase family protein [Actinomycetales bacterium]|nr:cryptochrome/photolyase family protein [Actinomycetales bacterium]